MNHLKNEKSLYLIEHADNPVNWYPYGNEAFAVAKKENKPVFISIGYSSCHWCHVMSTESFQNENIANMLNQNFISIKVDREEHPEVDAFYQKACQVFTGGSGWPLNGFLTPEGDPIFVGTYYPVTVSKENLPTFPQLINELSGAFKKDISGVTTNAKEVTKEIIESTGEAPEVKYEGHFPHPSIVLEAIKNFADEQNGGYGEAPKFPQFAFYEWAIEHIAQGNIPMEQGKHIIESLEKILCGGIFDHARGGIHRYSVDQKWLVPHFEKMLYDQAGLLKLLGKFSVIHPSPLVYDAIFNTLNYLEKEMLGTELYFFSSQDADSEGREGLYFTFTKEEFSEVLKSDGDEFSKEEIEKINNWFPMSDEGNFESGLNVISLDHSFLKETFNEQNWNVIRKVRKSLLNSRGNRIPPRTDQKGIASWNFLLLTSICDIIQYVNIPEIKQYASSILKKTLEPVLKTFTRVDEQKTKLLHSTSKKEKTNLFEDYAFFAELMLRSYEVSGNEIFKKNLKNVITMIRHEFYEGNSFYSQNVKQKEVVPNLSIDVFDQSFSSPLCTLVKVIRRARVLFGDENLVPEINEKFLKGISNKVLQNPVYHGEGLVALSFPDHFYQKLIVPREWLSEVKYVKVMQTLMSKVLLDYHDKKEWALWDVKQCVSSGETIDQLLETVAPKSEKEK